MTPILNRDSPIFPGRMARFAVVHRKEFSDRVAEYNSKVDSLIDSIEFDSNSKTNNEKKEKVKSSAHKKEEQNQAFHDYLHLVAHCLNELGAELIMTLTQMPQYERLEQKISRKLSYLHGL